MNAILKTKDSYFAKYIVPDALKRLILSKLKETFYCNSSMARFIEETYKVDFKELVLEICSTINVSMYGNKFVLKSDANAVETKLGVKFNSLERLIDCGSLRCRGIHLFDRSLKYICKNNYILYEIYMKGGRI